MDSNQQLVNEEVLRNIERGGDMTKAAAISATSYIRTVIKEEGLIRKLFTPIKLTQSQIDKSADTDKPIKIVEKEVDTTALSTPFRGAAPAEYISGNKYVVNFHKIETKMLEKEIFELRTYDNDIRKMLTDNGLKEIMSIEDQTFFTIVDAACAAAAATQIHAPGGGVNKDNILDGIKLFQSLSPKVGGGTMVMNDNTYVEIQKNFEYEDVGAIVEDFYTGNTVHTKVCQWPALISIKQNIIADNVIYLFATEDFMGKFFVLEDPTAYMETKKGTMLMWNFWEVIGLGIGNTASFVKIVMTAP